MKARDVVGKRIVRVEQSVRWDSKVDKRYADIQRLVLDDGTSITFTVRELESDYAVEAHAHRERNTR